MKRSGITQQLRTLLARLRRRPIRLLPATDTGVSRFVLDGPQLRPGWYMIELALRTPAGRATACFGFDHGGGRVENLTLNCASGQLNKRLCHLDSMPQAVSFDLDEGGEFTLDRLHFVRVHPLFARNRMLRRLCHHAGRGRQDTPATLWQGLQRQAREAGLSAAELLHQRYDATFLVAQARHGTGYADWIEKVEVPSLPDAATLQQTQAAFAQQPTVSVLLPVWNTPESLMRRAIESVLRQSWPHWQLCIADDASTLPHVRPLLEEYAARDSRIRLSFRDRNGHISAASNSALVLAEGEWVALLDHDDELAEHALHFMAEAINAQPQTAVLYSDEDKIDAEGNRYEPHFKSDWNPDLFFSHNNVGHLCLYRRELLERIGGFRNGVEGSQDHDLLLRCLPHLQPGQIVHVPRVLYHWRTLPGSTALAAGEKDYTAEAGMKAVRDHLTVQQPDACVEPGLIPNSYRVRYPLPQPAPLVSLLIPTRDRLELLTTCVDSILQKTDYPAFEILVLDNDSREPATLAYLERMQAEDERVRVLRRPGPFNFSAINNFGVRHARGELIGLVNNDIEVIHPDWLTEMASQALRPEIGCVGAKLYYDDGTLQHGGVILGIGGVAGHSHKYFAGHEHGYFGRLKLVQNLSAVTGACLLVRKAVYEAVGGLDEEHLRVAFNDVDFCLRVRQAGWRNLWTPYAELYHHESKSRGAEDTPEKQARFRAEVEHMRRTWGVALDHDPMYSPHLSLVREDFSLNVPIEQV